MAETVTANDGAKLDLASLPQSLTWSGSLVQSVSVVFDGNTYTQTFTYTGSNITGISGWIKQ